MHPLRTTPTTRRTATAIAATAALGLTATAHASAAPTFSIERNPDTATGGDEGLDPLWEAGLSLSHQRGRNPTPAMSIGAAGAGPADTAAFDWNSGETVDFTLTYDPGERVRVDLRDRYDSVSSVTWEADTGDLTDLRFGGSTRVDAHIDLANLIYNPAEGPQSPLADLWVSLPDPSNTNPRGFANDEASAWIRSDDGPMPAFEITGDLTMDFNRVRGEDMARLDISGFNNPDAEGFDLRSAPIPSPGPVALIAMSGLLLLQRSRH